MARFVLYTNTISPHQLPLAKELAARVGEGNFRYVYAEVLDKDHGGFGWSMDAPFWCVHISDVGADEWLENADVMLVGGVRPIGLCERRTSSGKTTLYMSERWFKPPIGISRLLHPKYFNMARRFVKVIRNEPSFTYLPIGIHAARDMARLCGLLAGDLRCLFRGPNLDFERKPGGRVWLTRRVEDSKAQRKYCLDKMVMWGYYVEPSKVDALPVQEASKPKPHEIKVLWVGRLLNWKRVDTIVRAVGEHANLKRVDNSLPKITLDIYGTGPEMARLKKLASKYGNAINIYPPVPITEVRKLMREHDVYVLSSNAYEGWGAVVSEALEEGIKVIGTYESGSSATILPNESLFHAGDWRQLLQLLQNGAPICGIGDWGAKYASEVLKRLK